mmetsp:Transcript_75051/g.216969  ORF Transcript_75051/g.216969 Transcript_75051/m.216969 type:complete len:335 (-) Transcript_75051:31-1035(-)
MMEGRQTVGTQTVPSKRELRSFARDEDERSTSASSGISEGDASEPDGSPRQPDAGKIRRRRPRRSAAVAATSEVSSYLKPGETPHWRSVTGIRLWLAAAFGACPRRRPQSEVAPKVPASTVSTPASSPTPPLAPPPGLLESWQFVGEPELPHDPVRELPPGFKPPPGLPAPPGLVDLLEVVGEPQQFDLVYFRRELVHILHNLTYDRNTGKAVQRVREQGVPEEIQADQYVDVLTRAVETGNGMSRRLIIAFCAGLAAGRPSAFVRDRCAKGVGVFFCEVYPQLLEDIPSLPTIISSELLPTLQSVFPAEDLEPLIPDGLRDRASAMLHRRKRH